MEPLATLLMTRALEDIDAANADMDPLTRLQEVRKRMKTGRHKYAIPGLDASQDSALEQPLLLPVDAPVPDEAAELVSLLRIRDARACRTCSQQAATSSTKTPAAFQPPLSTFSPPPTPGRDHGSVSSLTDDFPKFLPLDTSSLHVKTCAPNKTQSHFLPTLMEKADAALLLHLPPAETRLRLKPSFTSFLLRDLISSQQQSRANCSSSGDDSGSSSSSECNLPELPFYCQTSRSTSNENSIVKGSAKMPMARLPYRIRDISQRSTAA